MSLLLPDLEFSRLESWSREVSRPVFTGLGLGLSLGTSESWSWSWSWRLLLILLLLLIPPLLLVLLLKSWYKGPTTAKHVKLISDDR